MFKEDVFKVKPKPINKQKNYISCVRNLIHINPSLLKMTDQKQSHMLLASLLVAAAFKSLPS